MNAGTTTIPLPDDLVEGILLAEISTEDVEDYFSHGGIMATAHVDQTHRVVAIDCACAEISNERLIMGTIDHLTQRLLHGIKTCFTPLYAVA